MASPCCDFSLRLSSGIIPKAVDGVGELSASRKIHAAKLSVKLAYDETAQFGRLQAAFIIKFVNTILTWILAQAARFIYSTMLRYWEVTQR